MVGIVTAIALSLSDISLLYSPAGGYESDAMLLTIPYEVSGLCYIPVIPKCL
jgi:hypothetical protein